MERLVHDYLRILDVDPFGYFIRLINTSPNQSLDLSNINVRQFSNDMQPSNSYTFNDQIRPLLPKGETVTIYSRYYDRIKIDIPPNVFLAHDISRWFTGDDIHRIEISMNAIVIDCHRVVSSILTDIPLLFVNQPVNFKQRSSKVVSPSSQYGRFRFPYCLSTDDAVNPHTSVLPNRNYSQFPRNICYEKTQQHVKSFDSYARRLTTSPKVKQSMKKLGT